MAVVDKIGVNIIHYGDRVGMRLAGNTGAGTQPGA